MKPFTVKATVSEQRLSYVFVDAWEGGFSSAWMRADGQPYRVNDDLLHLPVTCYDVEDGDSPYAVDVPGGGRMAFDDFTGKRLKGIPYILDADAIQNGLNTMAACRPDLLAKIVDEEGDYDAVDADAFVQFCLFGELRYG